jgi:hypothetical protein
MADVSSDDDEDEVEYMVVDDPPPPPPPRARHERSKAMRAEIDKQRKERWDKIERANEKYKSNRASNGMTNESPHAGSSPFHSKSVPPESTGKRKGQFEVIRLAWPI